MKSIEEIIEAKKPESAVYSPANFLIDIDKDELVEETIIKPLTNDINNKSLSVVHLNVDRKDHYFITRLLEWDTRYCGFPTYRIELVLYDHDNLTVLNDAIKTFVDIHVKNGSYHFIDIPCEDVRLIEAFCSTRFRLVETRLNYYLPNVQKYESIRYSVRHATLEDIEEVKQVAVKMANKFDRVHADPTFTSIQADSYLGTFAEEAIKGFADFVLLPDVPDKRPFGFLAGNKPQHILGSKISKLVLAAIDSSVEKGWSHKLLSEMIYQVKEYEAEYLTTITQAANKAAIRLWEKAGFRLGSTTHVFSFRK